MAGISASTSSNEDYSICTSKRNQSSCHDAINACDVTTYFYISPVFRIIQTLFSY